MSTPFEAVEKRLMMSFPEENLRQILTGSELKRILEPVECEIEDGLSSEAVDSYVLSASSLFVYQNFMILKTCGNTQIMKCIEKILELVKNTSRSSVLYTRGSFMRPELQPFPHTSFAEETDVLMTCLKSNGDLKIEETIAEILTTHDRSWHAISSSSGDSDSSGEEVLTIEMSMISLDRDKASAFYKSSGKNMTVASGINLIFPNALLNSKEFAPYGYSMNGVEGGAISTIHVSPEEEVDFASFEAYGYNFKNDQNLSHLLGKVLACFKPKQFSVAIHSTMPLKGNEKHLEIQLEDYLCKGKVLKHLGQAGSILFYVF